MKAYLVHGFCVGFPRGDDLAVDQPLLDLRLLDLEQLRHRFLWGAKEYISIQIFVICWN